MFILGFNVKFGVDATRLSQHAEIENIKFDKIIFNFPHIKGKMKINLNRDLIREFFISSKSVLKKDGSVILALCAGQGGTQFDRNSRKWENTWQVVEMAAHGDYVLVDIEKFPSETFPLYLSSGFRGKSKSFNTVDALVHQFKQASPPIESIDDSMIDCLMKNHYLPGSEGIQLSYIYSSLLHKNPLQSNSPQKYISDLFLSCSENISNLICSHDLPYTVDSPNKDLHVPCVLNEKGCYLRNSLAEVLPIMTVENTYIFSGVNFAKVTSDFSKCPVNCEILITGKESGRIFMNFLDRLRIIAPHVNYEWVENDNSVKMLILFSENSNEKCAVCKLVKDNKIVGSDMFSIDVDIVSMVLFKIESWKQLWSENLVFTTEPVLIFKVPSLSPMTYSFDINFITSPKFNWESFIDLLWKFGHNLISAVMLLNTYHHPDNGVMSHCYRIVYKSYDKPLYRKRAVNFHENVIGKSLHMLYNVIIS